VSSYRTTSTFGAPSGARSGRNAGQSGVESRMSRLMTPANGFAMPLLPSTTTRPRTFHRIHGRCTRGEGASPWPGDSVFGGGLPGL